MMKKGRKKKMKKKKDADNNTTQWYYYNKINKIKIIKNIKYICLYTNSSIIHGYLISVHMCTGIIRMSTILYLLFDRRLIEFCFF